MEGRLGQLFHHAGDRIFHKAQKLVEVVQDVEIARPVVQPLSTETADRPEIKIFDPREIDIVHGAHKGDTFIRLHHHKSTK